MNPLTETINAAELAALRALPTLAVGQAHSLKREEYVTGDDGRMYLERVWLDRCYPDGGALVVIERRACPNGSWFDHLYLDPQE